MKIYRVEFSGIWLGGDAIIRAESKKDALIMLKSECEKSGVDLDDSFSEDKFIELSEAGFAEILKFYNGDY